MTQFEQAVQSVKSGKLVSPYVSSGGKEIDYFAFQLLNHLYILRLMAKGIKSRNFRLKEIKSYYGLKSRTAFDCLIELDAIYNKYLNK